MPAIKFKDVLKTECEALGMKLIHAKLEEANYGLDQIDDNDFPVFVLVSPTKFRNRQDHPHLVRRRIDMFGFILKKQTDKKAGESETADSLTDDVYPYFEECRVLGDNLVKKLNARRDVTDLEKDGIVEWDMNETAGHFDAHLHGVTFQCFWPTLGLLC